MAAILRRACDVHGDRTVTTATGGGCRYDKKSILARYANGEYLISEANE